MEEAVQSLLYCSIDFVQRLTLLKKVDAHTGCVNTVVWDDLGQVLLSGSDDRHLVISDPFKDHQLCRIHTAHRSNIFSAKFMPGSSNRTIVSCAGDGTIIYTDVEMITETRECKFSCHKTSVYDIITLPSERSCFLSCGEDATVRLFDLREATSCLRERCRERILLDCGMAVTALDVNPLKPYEIAVGTQDSTVRVYDRRMLPHADSTQRASLGQVMRMRPECLQGRQQRITCIRYDESGTHLLASYSGSHLYLFGLQDKISAPTDIASTGASSEKEQLSEDPPQSSEQSLSPAASFMKRLRLRGDWSDTGPEARPERPPPSATEQPGPLQPLNPTGVGQARPTLHSSLMQHMTNVLSRMLEGRPPRRPAAADSALAATTSGSAPASTTASVPLCVNATASDSQPATAITSSPLPATATAPGSVPPTAAFSDSVPATSTVTDSILTAATTARSIPAVATASGSVFAAETAAVSDSVTTSAPESVSTATHVDGNVAVTTSAPVATPASGDCTASSHLSFDVSFHNDSTFCKDLLVEGAVPLTCETQPLVSFGTSGNQSLATIESSQSPVDPPMYVERLHSTEPVSENNLPDSSSHCLGFPAAVSNASDIISNNDSNDKIVTITGSRSSSSSVINSDTSVLAPTEIAVLPSAAEDYVCDQGDITDVEFKASSCTNNDLCPDKDIIDLGMCGNGNKLISSSISRSETAFSNGNLTDENILSSASSSLECPLPGNARLLEKFKTDAPGQPEVREADDSLEDMECSPTSNIAFTTTEPTDVSLPNALSCQEAISTQLTENYLDATSSSAESTDAINISPVAASENKPSENSTAQSIDKRCSPVDHSAAVSSSSAEQFEASGSLDYHCSSSSSSAVDQVVKPFEQSPVPCSREVDHQKPFEMRKGSRLRRSESASNSVPMQEVEEVRGEEMEEESEDEEFREGRPAVLGGVSRDCVASALRQHVSRLRHEAAVRLDGEKDANISYAQLQHTYTGHRNTRTMIKEACFWGNDFVMSGSDCGRVFIWDRHTCKLVMLLEADRRVVNCLQPHPSLPILATSGIDYNVKLWAPLFSEPGFDEERAKKIMACNEMLLEESRDIITVPASFMIRLLNSLNHYRHRNRAQPDDEQPTQPEGGESRDDNIRGGTRRGADSDSDSSDSDDQMLVDSSD